MIFVAEAVPAFSAKRFYLKPGVCSLPPLVKAEASGLVSPEFSLRLDPQTGTISSLFSKGLKQELADPSRNALNDYLYLHGSDLKGLKRNGPVRISVKESGPVLASLAVESDAPGCRKLIREVRLIGGLPRVEVLNIVDKLAVRAKEGVHFGLAFKVPGGELRMDVPWAVVRPESDQIPGACKNWFTVEQRCRRRARGRTSWTCAASSRAPRRHACAKMKGKS